MSDLEAAQQHILTAAAALQQEGVREFHGFQVARWIDAAHPMGPGILYAALERLEHAGRLTSRWEEDRIASQECRPRRRYYRLVPDATAVALLIEATDLIAELVAQQCGSVDGTLDSMGISTYAEALRFLARRGRIEITKEQGRRVLARWTPSP